MFLFTLLVGIGTSVLAQPPLNVPNDVPYYYHANSMIKKSIADLNTNILSMDGKIPDLVDPRRHYIEIIHTIHTIALAQTHWCIPFPYYEVYQEYVNKALPEAISQPEKVINDVKELLQKFKKDSKKMQKLIDLTCTEKINPRDCDVVIDKIVKSDPKRYYTESLLFRDGGSAAEAFMKYSLEYYSVAEKLDATKFVIENPKKLKEVVDAYTLFLRRLLPFSC